MHYCNIYLQVLYIYHIIYRLKIMYGIIYIIDICIYTYYICNLYNILIYIYRPISVFTRTYILFLYC